MADTTVTYESLVEDWFNENTDVTAKNSTENVWGQSDVWAQSRLQTQQTSVWGQSTLSQETHA